MPGNMYIEMPLPDDPRSFVQNQEKLDQMAKKESLGEETVNGYDCEKARFKFNNTAYGTMTQWFSHRLNWPVKTESKSSYGTTISEYENIEVGNVPDAIFELPAGYQKLSMPGMPRRKPGK
jgi:hypothetical protein